MRFNYEWFGDGVLMESEKDLTLADVLDAMGVEDTWNGSAPGVVRAKAAQDAFVETLRTLKAVGETAELVERADEVAQHPETVVTLKALGVPIVGLTRVTVASV